MLWPEMADCLKKKGNGCWPISYTTVAIVFEGWDFNEQSLFVRIVIFFENQPELAL